MHRREWLTAAAGLAAGATLACWPSDARAARTGKARRPLRILILGGTRFIGVHMAELALARGHAVTFFNRGRTRTEVLPQVERLRGDRNGDLGSLKGRQWDAVIDNSGYVPRQVRIAADVLRSNVSRYLFISTISVYPDFSVPRGEDSILGKLQDETAEKVDNETYGPLKALCEQAAMQAFGDRATVLRPGLIVGPYDNTDRFTYWPARAARGGAFLAPGTPNDAIQIIDARDLADFSLRCLEQSIGGTFNVVSKPGQFSMGQLVDESIRAARQLARPATPPKPLWVDAAFLEAQNIAPWSEMPVWLPASGTEAAFAGTPATRATAAGLRISPLRRKGLDTLRWHLMRPESERVRLKAGLAMEKEAAALAALQGSVPPSAAAG